MASANANEKYISILGDAPTEAGAIVFWNSANAVQRPVLAAAWADAGLTVALLPPDKTPEVALRESVDDVCARRRFRRKAPKGGWVVVNESEQGGALQWDAGATCTLDKVGRLSVTFPAGAAATPDDVALEGELRAAYERHLWELDGATVTGWLVSLARNLNAVALKDTGGVYFVPRESLAQWRAMMTVVAATTGMAVQEIATVLVEQHAERIIAAIVSAVEREAGSEAEGMLNDIADPTKPLGKRALETRTKRVEALKSKVVAYGNLLGASMDKLGERLEQLSAAIATASLAAPDVEA